MNKAMLSLKTAMQIGAVFPIVMAILVVLGLVIRAQESQKVVAAFQQIDGLVENTGELSRLTQRYFLRDDRNMVGPWKAKHEAVDRILNQLGAVRSLDRNVLESLRQTNGQIADLFTELSQNRSGQRTLQELVLEDDLFQLLLEMSADAFTLAKSSHAYAVSAQNDADMVVAPLFGILALVIAGGILIAGRILLRKFALVQEGIAAVSMGDFDHFSRVAPHNSSDPLSEAFHRMSSRLKNSQAELMQELDRQGQSADSLRKTNMLLSDALVKLKRAQKQAVSTERLKALSQVSGGVVHRFKNCLSPILALSDFMIAHPEKLENRSALLEHLQTINEAALKARDQIFRLSDFFGTTRRTTAANVNINRIVEETVMATEPRWKTQSEGNGISISVRTALGVLPEICADAGDLREMLTNLIFNSVEAMPRGGTITITTREDNGRIALFVADDGEGMSEQVRERACEPFFSTKSDQSAGMGLAVVSGVVRAMNGVLNITSTPGSGTTVSILLPVSAKSLETLSAGGAAPGPRRLLSVLVIDDEASVRFSVSKLLAGEGHTVDSAAGGRDGLDKLRSARFDVLIQDQALPGGFSGTEIAKAAKEIDPKLRVILLTGFGDDWQHAGKLPESVDMIMGKPATLKELRQALEEVTRA